MSNLVVGDIAHSLGIKKTKVGGGDKNVAYIVDSNTMTYGLWIIAAVLGCFAIGFFLRNFELQIKNKNYVGALEQADEIEELALERVMEIGLTLEDFLRREALEEDLVDKLELVLVRTRRTLLNFISSKMDSSDAIKAQTYLNEMLQPVVRFLEDRKTEAVEAKLVLGEVNQMLGQDDLVPEAPVDNSAWTPSQHQWEMDNLGTDELGKRDYAHSVDPAAVPKPAARAGKIGLTHGRDLASRIDRFFEGVKAAMEVSFPQGFAEKFEKFKKSLGGSENDPEKLALSGARRWELLASLLKQYNVMDVDKRSAGDASLRERLLYMMYREVDAILVVKSHKKILDTLEAGYKAGNLQGGELMRILHSQKTLHEAFDWLFGESENAEIIDAKTMNQNAGGVAGGSRNVKKDISAAAKKITEDYSVPNYGQSKQASARTTGFHHAVDKEQRAKSRSGIDIGTKKATDSASKYDKPKFKQRPGTTTTARTGAASDRVAETRGQTRGRVDDSYDLGKVPRRSIEEGVDGRNYAKSAASIKDSRDKREAAVDEFLAGAEEIEGYLDNEPRPASRDDDRRPDTYRRREVDRGEEDRSDRTRSSRERLGRRRSSRESNSGYDKYDDRRGERRDDRRDDRRDSRRRRRSYSDDDIY